ncbi:SUR7/PalI family-domain-containing protein [Phyllosticta capitalensis]|uniref:SUR7/PalI family-domain-containing protein n=1 Tax=Phyllosticta capitalensis TaxID=121624 RepID=A0ABR1YHV0_9PEZI
MVARPVLGLLGQLILAGGIVMQFLVILSGGVHGDPENQIWFLQASTDGVANSPRDPSRWTFWSICGVDSNTGRNTNCGAPVPALPFDPPRNFGTKQGLPEKFNGTHHYYYLSRFMFAFYLMAIIFAAIALFTGLLAMCSRLGGYISGFNTSLALFFQTIAAALMTAWTVQGRDAFRGNGQSAKLGVKAYAFTWAAVACFLTSTVLFCIAPRETSTTKANRGFWVRRQTSTRSRGSFADVPPKDGYA